MTDMDTYGRDNSGAEAAIQGALDQQLADIRLAAVLNVMDIARSHGEHHDWTDAHASQIRAMLAISEAAVVGSEDSVVPQGFGTPIRTKLAAAFMRARTKAET